jgi:cytidylate kinase
VALEDVEAALAQRDAQDAARATAPLRAAPGAVVIDTTGLDEDAAYSQALAVVQSRLG